MNTVNAVNAVVTVAPAVAPVPVPDTTTYSPAIVTLATLTNRTPAEVADSVKNHLAIYPKLHNVKHTIKSVIDETVTIDDFKEYDITDDRIKKFNLTKCIETYNEYNYSNYMLLGFTRDLKKNPELNGLYMFVCESSDFMNFITLDRYSGEKKDESFSYNHVLRYYPLKAHKQKLIENGLAIKICDIATWKNFTDKSYYYTKKSGYRKATLGESFEMFCTEYFDTTDKHWTKDNNDFSTHHDIVSHNIGYNIKFEKGTLCQILKLENLSGLHLAEEINK